MSVRLWQASSMYEQASKTRSFLASENMSLGNASYRNQSTEDESSVLKEDSDELVRLSSPTPYLAPSLRTCVGQHLPRITANEKSSSHITNTRSSNPQVVLCFGHPRCDGHKVTYTHTPLIYTCPVHAWRLERSEELSKVNPTW